MASLRTTFARLNLKNPLIAASSGLTNSVEKIKELEEAGIAAVVLKSLFEEQIDNHSEKLQSISDYPEASDYINAYIEKNHVDKYLDLIRSVKSECSIPVIASINCYKQSRWIEFAKNIENAGADALELNVILLDTCDNGDNYIEESYLKIVRELRKTIRIPIIVKMSRNLSNLCGLVGKLHALGVDGVVLFNRLYQLDIDINKLEIVSGPIFSHPSDFSDTLRWTAILSGRLPKVDIGCSYGIHTWDDVVKGILAGASAIELCSALYEKGPDFVSEVLTCLEEWMAQKNYNEIKDFKKKLNFATVPDPSVYERVQFMKYFSNYRG